MTPVADPEAVLLFIKGAPLLIVAEVMNLLLQEEVVLHDLLPPEVQAAPEVLEVQVQEVEVLEEEVVEVVAAKNKT